MLGQLEGRHDEGYHMRYLILFRERERERERKMIKMLGYWKVLGFPVLQ
jgi:hypothetical protein